MFWIFLPLTWSRDISLQSATQTRSLIHVKTLILVSSHDCWVWSGACFESVYWSQRSLADRKRNNRNNWKHAEWFNDTESHWTGLKRSFAVLQKLLLYTHSHIHSTPRIISCTTIAYQGSFTDVCCVHRCLTAVTLSTMQSLENTNSIAS